MINKTAVTARPAPVFEATLARSADMVLAAQRLRYAVFVEELGAVGPMVDHDARLEIDRFDASAEQLVLLDHTRAPQDRVVGVYRIMDQRAADAAGQFYSEDEFDVSVLRASNRPLLELGRSCVHKDYRGGSAMMHLWQGLAQIVQDKGAEVLFGAASLPGVDPKEMAQSLSILARDHLAPPELRVTSKAYQNMTLSDQVDRVRAMRQMPALIKAYLRLGGFVGDGAFVDHQFNTTDVCLVLDVARMNPRQRAIYAGAS